MVILERNQLACLLRISREEALIFIAFLSGKSSREIAEIMEKEPAKIRDALAKAISRMPRVTKSCQR